MAATLTLASASPYALKYLYQYDGAAANAISRTKAQMIADLDALGEQSPLKDLLAATDAAWDDLPGSSKLSVYVTNSYISGAAAATPVQADITTNASQELYARTIQGAAVAAKAWIEVRMHHTFDR